MRVWLAPQDPGRDRYVTSGRTGKNKEQAAVRQEAAEAHRARGDLQLAETVDLGSERYAGTQLNYYLMVGCKVC